MGTVGDSDRPGRVEPTLGRRQGSREKWQWSLLEAEAGRRGGLVGRLPGRGRTACPGAAVSVVADREPTPCGLSTSPRALLVSRGIPSSRTGRPADLEEVKEKPN